MKRTAINPTSWSQQFGFNQGELVEGHTRTLFLSGQTSIGDDGRVQHAGDLRAQAGLALDSVESVLAEAGMTLSNVVRMTIYTTEIDELFKNFDVLTGRLDAAGIKPVQTLLGITRLALPELMVEIEATAVA